MSELLNKFVGGKDEVEAAEKLVRSK